MAWIILPEFKRVFCAVHVVDLERLGSVGKNCVHRRWAGACSVYSALDRHLIQTRRDFFHHVRKRELQRDTPAPGRLESLTVVSCSAVSRSGPIVENRAVL